MEKELTLHTPVNSVENSTDSLDGDSSTADTDSSSSSSPSRSNLSSVTLLGSPPDLISNAVINGSKEGTSAQEQDMDTSVETALKPDANGSTNTPYLEEDENLKGVFLFLFSFFVCVIS